MLGSPPKRLIWFRWLALGCPLLTLSAWSSFAAAQETKPAHEAKPAESPNVRLRWKDNLLTVEHPGAPKGGIKIWYLEAYCRPGSTDRDWHETTIGHRTTLVEEDQGRRLKLRCALNDGVTVDHVITAHDDEVDFQLTAHNPTDRESLAHWAQPCVRLAGFAGVEEKKNGEEYLPKCFLYLDGRPTRMPMAPWSKQARYVPGQVWRPKHVDPNDVNPRPVSPLTPSHGLIGCFSADDSHIFATAWEPYQELFQGILCCLHSDFRIGGLKPGETKKIRGKIYLVKADLKSLTARYLKDFPEHDAPNQKQP